MTQTAFTATRLAAETFDAQHGATEAAAASLKQAQKVLDDAKAAAAQLNQETKASIAARLRAAEDAREADIRAYVAREKENRLAQEVAHAGLLALSLRDDFDALGPQLVDLVIMSVRKIIGTPACKDAIAQVVYQAMDTLRHRWDLDIRTGTAVLEQVKAAIAAHPDASDWINAVTVDDTLGSTDIRIIHKGGISDVGLNVQLDNLEAALRLSLEAHDHDA